MNLILVIFSSPLSYQNSSALYFRSLQMQPMLWKIGDICDTVLLFDISFTVLYNWVTCVIFLGMLTQMPFYVPVAYCIVGIAFFFANEIRRWIAFIWFTAINMDATNFKSKYSSIHIYICKGFLWPLWRRFPCG